MILQELLRNWILYREVLKPVISSWKDSFAANSSPSNLNLVLNKARASGGGEEFGWDISDEDDARALSQMSGTRTITNLRSVSPDTFNTFHETDYKREQFLSGREAHIVLARTWVYENTAVIGKTDVHSDVLTAEILIPSSPKTMSATTGYESKQINSFLSLETHEKRENLGDFSLTHEETPLQLFLKKGGEYHDINQESVAAIV